MKFCTSIVGIFALLFSATALFAAAPWTGSGMDNDPYLVGTPQELKDVATEINAGNYADSAFKLTADIDLDSTVQSEFTAIGTYANHFRGVFDGGSHIISNLYINQPDSDYQGLFGYAQNADIRNIGLDSAWVIGASYVGGLIGNAYNSSVSNAYATGSVSGKNGVGGLIGWANGSVSNAYATGSVSGNIEVGGLIGVAKKSSVTNAYATGGVSGETSVGGLIGRVEKSSVTNAYATGSVSGDEEVVGGLIGGAFDTTVTNAYAAGNVSGTGNNVGGLIGYANGTTVVNAYWDKESTGQNASLGGIAKTTAELKNSQFVRTLGMNAWRWDESQELNNGYPVLVSQGGTVVLWDGNGTQSDPFQIANAEDLKNVARQVNLKNYADSAFKLTADINLDSKVHGEFTAIGIPEKSFLGNFDGDSHIISNLYINQPNSNCQGLFGYANNADIRNIGLDSVWVIGGGKAGGLIGIADGTTVTNAYATGSVSGKEAAGGLIGWALSHSRVSNAYATGSVSGENGVGGLLGAVEESSVTNAYATGSVSGADLVGGLIGQANVASVSDVYATGRVLGQPAVGGLIGGAYTSTVANAYATGSVSGNRNVGGLIGHVEDGTTVTNAYATGSVSGTKAFGGLIGVAVDGPTVTNAYWDKESTGQSISAGGIAKTTAELKNSQFVRTLGINAWRWDKTQQLNNGYPVLAFQGGTVVLWNGNGTQSDPFQIANAEDLKAVSAQVNAGNYADSAFKLTADINLDSTVHGEFTAIGTVKSFLGNFDGDSHIISNLYINQPDSNCQGLFGYADNADIRNIGLDSVWVIGGGKAGGLIGMAWGSTVTNAYATGSVSGKEATGGLIGWALYHSRVSNAYATGSVSGENGVGGLLGAAEESSVTNAYATGSVSGADVVGGLIGQANVASVSDVYATGRVLGQAAVGGLIGRAYPSTVTNAYATGSVSGNRNVGGLIGHVEDGTVTNAYATGSVSGTGNNVGGLIGVAVDGPMVTNAYWDKESTGQSISAGGIAKTTAELKNSQFVRTLGINAWRWDKTQQLNNGYPVLAGQGGTPISDVPVFTPASCEFSGSLSVTLAALPAGASVYYGEKADLSDSKLYTAPFTVTQTCTIYAVSVLGEEISPVSSSVYTSRIEPIVVNAPEFFPASQSYSTPTLTVTLINKTADAKMEYGFKADLADAKAYKAPFTIRGTQTVYARAKLAESTSTISSAAYTFIQPKPEAVVALGTRVEVSADSFKLTDPLSKKKTKLEALYTELFPKPGKTPKTKKLSVKMVSDTAFEDKGVVRLLNQKLYKQALKNESTRTTAKVLAADSGIWAVQKDSVMITVTVKLKGKNRSDAIWIKAVPPTLDSYRFVDSAYLVVSVKDAGAKPKAFFEYLEANRANVFKLKKMTLSFFPAKKWVQTGIDFKTFFPGKDIVVFKTSAKKLEKLPAVHDLVLDNKNGLGVK